MKLGDLGPDICLDCGRDNDRCRCAELDDPPDDPDVDDDDGHELRHTWWHPGCADCDERADRLEQQRRDEQRVRIEPGDLGPEDERWAQP